MSKQMLSDLPRPLAKSRRKVEVDDKGAVASKTEPLALAAYKFPDGSRTIPVFSKVVGTVKRVVRTDVGGPYTVIPPAFEE